MPQTLDFISLVPWTFVAMIANVYILYRLMRRFLFKPVQEILEKRQQTVDEIYDEADKAKADAEQIKNEYEQKLSTADREAKTVIASAMDAAQKRESEMLADAKSQANHIVAIAEADAEQIQRKAVLTLKDDISQMAVDIARKVMQKEIDQETHQQLIDDSIKQLEEGQQ